jgi:uncharacterized coiled-coil DUF342 family protein
MANTAQSQLDPLEMVVYEIRELKNDVKETRKEIREDVSSLRENLNEITAKVSDQIAAHDKSINEAQNIIKAKAEQCENRDAKIAELEKTCAECKPKVDSIHALKNRVTALIFTVLGGITMAGATVILKSCGVTLIK